MQFSTPIITTAGKDAGINVIFGQGKLEFNRVAIGKGKLAAENIATATTVASAVMDAELLGYEPQGDSMILRFTFNNRELTEAFDWTEFGVFAKYTPNDGTEAKTILYCYAYDTTDSSESVPMFTGSTSYYKAKFDLGVSVGNADNVTVNLGDYTDFVAKEELQNHETDTNNPHRVTKEQIGLGNVENLSVNDTRPTFVESSKLSNIVSGETTTGLWGKVKKAISTLINHINDSNPHHITLSKIGAAASVHNHSASEITTGILSTERGGTGEGNIYNFFERYGLNHFRLKNGHGATINNTRSIFKLQNGLTIVMGFESITASGNSCGRTTVSWTPVQFFEKFPTPIVLATPYAAINSVHAAADNVQQTGFDLVLQNNASSSVTAAVFYLVVG